MMESSGPASAAPEGTRRLLGYTTIVSRRVKGVHVEGSRAWAQVNQDGVVVAEDVWWPELPEEVAQSIDELRQLIADPTRVAAYRDSLPADVREQHGELTVHHNDPTQAALGVNVTFDIHSKDAVRRFDKVARELVPLVTQAVGAPLSAKPSVPKP